jgi:hypothetical protein
MTTQKQIYKNPKSITIPETLRNYLKGRRVCNLWLIEHRTPRRPSRIINSDSQEIAAEGESPPQNYWKNKDED